MTAATGRVPGMAVSGIENEGVLPNVIHEHLPSPQLRDLGWAKGIELAKLARRDRQNFDCAIWLPKAREMPTQDFKERLRRN